MTILTADDQEVTLRRAVEISLFTWRRANLSDRVDDDERYGWWGDSYPAVTNDKIGSRLWMLRRAKLTTETVGDAVTYAREALQWLVDDGHVLSFEVLTDRASNYRLNLGVLFELPDGDQLEIYPHQDWQVIYAV